MITIALCTPDDYAAVAALWNARRMDTASCWAEAAAIEASYVATLAAAQITIVVARVDGLPQGFGLWYGPASSLRLVALAAEDEAVYYHLMAAFCQAGLALGATSAYAELGTALTRERTRMDALGVIAYTPTGFLPLAPGADPSQRVPSLLRAECELHVLHQAVLQMLEDLA